MKLRFLAQEALQALKSNLLRSLLTIMGIVVGIFAVTAMLALGEGLSQNVLERFNAFSSGDLTVTGDITLSDLAWIEEQAYTTDALGTLDVSGVEVIAFGTDFSPSVESVVGDYEAVQGYDIVSGDVFDFTDLDLRENVAVVSDGFADSVKETTGQTVQGQTISVSGLQYTVIGVIESASSAFTRGDGLILVPHGSVVGTLVDSPNVSSVGVMLEDATYFEIAGEHIKESLNASRHLDVESEEMFEVETAQAFIESAEETTGMISLFLGIVGGIALFVGGIGTMNMMLTTVTERTKEIGLRKAIGARDRDILLQILAESVALTLLGGLAGILLSIGVAQIANNVFADSAIISVIISLEVVLWAAFVSFAVGVVFGVYPAHNASKLQPVDALRAD